MRHVARGLTARQNEVEVWTVDRGEHLGEQMIDGVRARYFSTPLPARRLPNLLTFTVSAPWALARWVRAARLFRPDVLHVHCFGPNGIYALALSKLLRVPLVVTSHGETFGDAHDIFGNSALIRHGLIAASHAAAAVTGCSTLVAEDLETRFAAAGVRVVPNGVDVAPILPTPAPLIPPRPGTRPRIVAVGRLVRVKVSIC